MKILSNELTAGGITVASEQGEDIEIAGNRFTGPEPKKIAVSKAEWVKENTSFAGTEIVVPNKKRRKK